MPPRSSPSSHAVHPLLPAPSSRLQAKASGKPRLQASSLKPPVTGPALKIRFRRPHVCLLASEWLGVSWEWSEKRLWPVCHSRESGAVEGPGPWKRDRPRGPAGMGGDIANTLRAVSLHRVVRSVPWSWKCPPSSHSEGAEVPCRPHVSSSSVASGQGAFPRPVVRYGPSCPSRHPSNSYVEALTSSTSEHDCLWRRGLGRENQLNTGPEGGP